MKLKFMILGYARHGKDTVAEILRDNLGLKFARWRKYAESSRDHSASGSLKVALSPPQNWPGLSAPWFMMKHLASMTSAFWVTMAMSGKASS